MTVSPGEVREPIGEVADHLVGGTGRMLALAPDITLIVDIIYHIELPATHLVE
jgi:hypothetical protein